MNKEYKKIYLHFLYIFYVVLFPCQFKMRKEVEEELRLIELEEKMFKGEFI